MELVKNNAKVAAQISCKIEELRNHAKKREEARVVFCGGMAVDISGRAKQDIKDNSNIGEVEVIRGGCCRNVLECLNKLGVKDTLFISAIGNDALGKLLIQWMDENGVSQEGILHSSTDHTATYMCTMKEGNLDTGISDMDILKNIPVDHFKQFSENLKKAKILMLDSNISVEALEYLCNEAKNAFITFDPISDEKSLKILEKNLISKITLIKGSVKQYKVLTKKISGKDIEGINDMIKVIFDHAKGMGESKLKYVLVTKENNVFCGYVENGEVKLLEKTSQKIEKESIKTVGGAGDCLMGGLIYGQLKELNIEKSIEIGMKCAATSLTSVFNVNPELSAATIQ